MYNPYYDDQFTLAAGLLNISTYINEEGFRYSQILTVRHLDFEKLKTLIKTYNGEFHSADSDSGEGELIFKHLALKIIVAKQRFGVKFNIAILSRTDHKHVIDFILANKTLFCVDDDRFAKIYVYRNSSGSIAYEQMYVDTQNNDEVNPELYPDIDINLLVKDYNASDESILILHGEPGVGKTSFIKYMIYSGKYKNIAYAKDVSALNKSAFWDIVIDQEHDLLILDDLSMSLGPRTKSKDDNFVSDLLSYSDGIFKDNRAKIIITTNEHIKEVDHALIRPGRCFDFLQLNPLQRHEALDFWTKRLTLDVELFKETFDVGLDIISQASLMSEYKRILAGSKTRSYIKKGNRKYSIEEKLRELNINVGSSSHADKFGFN